MSAKMGRPTLSLRDYTLKVRLCDEELRMLDFLCTVENKKRSEMVRRLIVASIRMNYYDYINEDKPHDENIKELLQSYDIQDAYDTLFPNDEEIDNV